MLYCGIHRVILCMLFALFVCNSPSGEIIVIKLIDNCKTWLYFCCQLMLRCPAVFAKRNFTRATLLWLFCLNELTRWRLFRKHTEASPSFDKHWENSQDYSRETTTSVSQWPPTHYAFSSARPDAIILVPLKKSLPRAATGYTLCKPILVTCGFVNLLLWGASILYMHFFPSVHTFNCL